MPHGTARFFPYSICLATAALQVWSSSVFSYAGITSSGIRYSNIDPLHERRTGSLSRSGEQASQGKPAFLRQLSLRYRRETAQSRLRSKQIVITGVPPVFNDIVPDGQQMALLVEEEIIFHTGEFAGLRCKLFDSRDPFPGTQDCIIISIKVGQLSQCRYLPADTRKIIETVRRSRQQCPWRNKSQFMEGGPALTCKGMSPPRGLIIVMIIVMIFWDGAIISSILGCNSSNNFPGGRCQLIKAQPGCHKCRWRGIVCRLHIPLKAIESFMRVYSLSSYFFSIPENLRKSCQCVAESVKHPRSQYLLIGKC